MARPNTRDTDQSRGSDLTHLIYVSRASNEFAKAASVDGRVIRELAEICNTNNRALGITGLLIYGRGRFVQLLEGSHASVHELYGIIREDPRHTQIQHVLSGAARSPLFRSWHMGVLDLTHARQSDRQKLDLLIQSLSQRAGEDDLTSVSRALLWDFRNLLGGQDDQAAA